MEKNHQAKIEVALTLDGKEDLYLDGPVNDLLNLGISALAHIMVEGSDDRNEATHNLMDVMAALPVALDRTWMDKEELTAKTAAPDAQEPGGAAGEA